MTQMMRMRLIFITRWLTHVYLLFKYSMKKGILDV
jgi:hypothetical protein